MIPEHLRFSYLKRRVSILDVLIENGLIAPFKKRGDQLVGPCPLHGGDNPTAFAVSLSKNVWRCFTRCDSGRDVVEFVRRLHKTTWSQTAVYLAGLAARSGASSAFQNALVAKPDKAFRPYVKRLHLDSADAWFAKKGHIFFLIEGQNDFTIFPGSWFFFLNFRAPFVFQVKCP